MSFRPISLDKLLLPRFTGILAANVITRNIGPALCHFRCQTDEILNLIPMPYAKLKMQIACSLQKTHAFDPDCGETHVCVQ